MRVHKNPLSKTCGIARTSTKECSHSIANSKIIGTLLLHELICCPGITLGPATLPTVKTEGADRGRTINLRTRERLKTMEKEEEMDGISETDRVVTLSTSETINRKIFTSLIPFGTKILLRKPTQRRDLP
jgi:hypothetical protein